MYPLRRFPHGEGIKKYSHETDGDASDKIINYSFGRPYWLMGDQPEIQFAPGRGGSPFPSQAELGVAGGGDGFKNRGLEQKEAGRGA